MAGPHPKQMLAGAYRSWRLGASAARSRSAASRGVSVTSRVYRPVRAYHARVFTDVALVLIVVLVLVLLWRGPRMLPRLGESFGQAVRGARRTARERLDDGDTKDTGASR